MAEPEQAGWKRGVYVSLGLGFVGLGALGAVLPVLPTTPFLLLASYFFVRSSPRLHAWLLHSRVFGGLLRDWHHHRAVRPRVKVTAVLLIVTAVACSALFGSLSWPWLVVLGALATVGLVVVLRLPVMREAPAEA